jgi:acyl-coenzyme A synthetase/AMP-(fatty) acid ligase
VAVPVRSLAGLLVQATDDRVPVAFRRGAAGARDRVHLRGEWEAAIASLRDRLRAGGLGTGARIALHEEDPHAFSIGLMACWQIGAVAVLPPNVQPGSLDRLRDSVDAAIGAGGDWLPGLPGFTALAETAVRPKGAGGALHAIDRDAPVVELFTSGTTGDGKAAPKRLRHLDDEVGVLERTFGPALSGARVYATASHQHLYGLLFRVLWPLVAGRPFCCDRLLHGEELLPRLAEEPRVVLASVPAHLARLAASSAIGMLAGTRCTVFSSGGPLPAETAHVWERACGDAPIEIFGSTETGGVAYRRQRAAAVDLAGWTPFEGVVLGIDAPTSRLRVRSPALSENEAAGFAMGDRARLLGDGRLELGGRVDRVVKVGEKRLELAEMESRLRGHPAVAQAALVAIEQAGQTRVGAVVVPSDAGARRLAAEGRAAVGRLLADHLALDFDRVLVPRAWRYVDALPEDAQGKVAAVALRALFTPDGATAPRAPAWHERAAGAGWIEVRGQVPDDLASLEGHFPGRPVVPGTAQLDWAVELARELVGAGLVPARVEALKFGRPLTPGAVCALRVERNDPAASGERSGAVRVVFRLFAGSGGKDAEEPPFASGRLELVAPEAVGAPDA